MQKLFIIIICINSNLLKKKFERNQFINIKLFINIDSHHTIIQLNTNSFYIKLHTKHTNITIMSSNLSFFYQNTRGLRSKIKLGLRNRISLTDYHVIAFTESWLNDQIESESIFDETFVVYRADRTLETYQRTHNVGGGCLIAIKKKPFLHLE